MLFKYRELKGLTLNDPRYLDSTYEQMFLELRFYHYLYGGGEREAWFEEEAKRDQIAGKVGPNPVELAATDEEKAEAYERLMSLVGGSVSESGFFTATPLQLED